MVLDTCGKVDHENKKESKIIILKKLEVNNLSQKIGNQIYSRLRNELMKSGNVNIISGGNSSKGAQVITGMVGKVGSAYIISLKIKDSKTGNTKFATGDCNGSVNELLNKVVPQVARKILR